jgi:hypothetical protein
VEQVTSADPQPSRRRARGAQESLLSIVLALEAFVVFFAALVSFSLRVVELTPALVGGAVFIVLLLLCGRVVGTRAGRALGWVLQLALIATGVLLPLMFLIGAGFAIFWTWCFVRGASLDRAKAHAVATAPSPPQKETPA